MSQENVELVKAMFANVQSGDWPGALSCFDPDVDLDMSRMPDGGVYRGRDEVWSFYRRWLGTWEEFETHPSRFIEIDRERVLVLNRVSGRGKGSSVEVTMDSANLYTVRDGRIVVSIGYPDAREALDGLGL